MQIQKERCFCLASVFIYLFVLYLIIFEPTSQFQSSLTDWSESETYQAPGEAATG